MRFWGGRVFCVVKGLCPRIFSLSLSLKVERMKEKVVDAFGFSHDGGNKNEHAQ